MYRYTIRIDKPRRIDTAATLENVLGGNRRFGRLRSDKIKKKNGTQHDIRNR